MDTKITDEEFPLKVAEPTAEWHVPDREQTLRRPLDGMWQRALAWLFLATGFVFYVFVRRDVRTEFAYSFATSQAIFLVGLSQALLFYLYRVRASSIDVGTGMRRLRSKVPPTADLPVNVEIVREGSVTGRDRGFIWLSEGTWYFKGLQTAFRFNQHDVVPVEAWPRAIAPNPSKDKPPRVLPMKSRVGRLELRIDVIDPYEDYAKRKRVNGFYREMFDWLNERPRGAIESLLPPMKVHPDLAVTGPTKYEGLFGAAVMLAVDCAMIAGLPAGAGSSSLGDFGLLAAGVVSALVLVSVRLAWLELRDASVRARLSRDPKL